MCGASDGAVTRWDLRRAAAPLATFTAPLQGCRRRRRPMRAASATQSASAVFAAHSALPAAGAAAPLGPPPPRRRLLRVNGDRDGDGRYLLFLSRLASHGLITAV